MKNLFLFLLLLTLSCNTQALKQEDLLHPDKAFQFSAAPVSPELVRLTWDIADGYYLYRSRFAFDSETELVTLNNENSNFPDGKIKDDPNLGKQEVYYKQVAIDVPVERGTTAQAAIELKLKAKFQGCADAGLCYPPQRKKATLTLAALTEPAPTATDSDTATQKPAVDAPGAITPLSELSTAKTQIDSTEISDQLFPSIDNIPVAKRPLPIDQAFRFKLTAIDKSTLNAQWIITPEHQLYKTKINFKVKSPAGLKLGQPLFPKGKIVDDEFFGTMEVFDNEVNVSIPLLEVTSDQITIETSYQGCSNATGVCYPPLIKNTQLSLAGLPDKAPATTSNSGDTSLPMGSEFFSGSFLGILLAFFIIGLGLSLTPCIFPMIPILSGIIAGQTHISARRAFILSLVYVLASASAYALIGLVFGFFGENLQSSLQHPIAIGLFAALFVILSMSMFGFFDLQMPNSIQSRLNEISNNQRSGSLVGAAIMGFLSTLIVGPCVAPALAAALTYIANSKDAVLGASALFSMGFGMGVILLIVGTLGGHLLPRAGVWMDTTKAIFGIMLLGMAIWMLDRIVPVGITMLLTGILLVVSGIYMGALDKLQDEASGWSRFWKSIGLIMLFYGSTHLLGVSAGSQNILQPLKGIFSVSINGNASGITSQHQPMAFRRIKTVADLDSVLAQARQTKQQVMLDFYADWCTDCIRMEKNVFSDPTIQQTLSNVILLQADVTKHDQDDRELEKKLGIIGPPTIIFFDTNSNEIKPLRMIGYEDTGSFMQRIQQLRNH